MDHAIVAAAPVADKAADPDGLTIQALARAADQLFGAAYLVRPAAPTAAPLTARLGNLDEAAETAPYWIALASDANGRLYAAQDRAGLVEDVTLTSLLREIALEVVA